MPAPDPPDFHFNGQRLPHWGACWSLAGINDLLKDCESWDEDFGHRDVWIISCRIDHEGTVESADPEIFIYVIQEVLLLLLRHSVQVLEKLKGKAADPLFVHRNLVEAAFEMRRLTGEQSCAFWTSGEEADRLKSVEWMEQSRLPEDDPRHRKPPHIQAADAFLNGIKAFQAKELHRLAQEGRLDREIRKLLLGI